MHPQGARAGAPARLGVSGGRATGAVAPARLHTRAGMSLQARGQLVRLSGGGRALLWGQGAVAPVGGCSCTPRPQTHSRGHLLAGEMEGRILHASLAFAVPPRGPACLCWEMASGLRGVWGGQPKSLPQPGPEPAEPGAGGWQRLLCPWGAGIEG